MYERREIVIIFRQCYSSKRVVVSTQVHRVETKHIEFKKGKMQETNCDISNGKLWVMIFFLISNSNKYSLPNI